MSVIGVVADARYRGIQRPRPAVYLPYRQAPNLPRYFVVRTQGDPLAVLGAARAAARSLDRSALVADVATLESLVGRALTPWRFAGGLLTGFAAIALLLTVSGLFGVLHRFVTLRTREVAIRMAIGATPGHVAQRVLAQGLATTLLGLLVGVAASLALAGSLAALLYGVSDHDPQSYLRPAFSSLPSRRWPAGYPPAAPRARTRSSSSAPSSTPPLVILSDSKSRRERRISPVPLRRCSPRPRTGGRTLQSNRRPRPLPRRMEAPLRSPDTTPDAHAVQLAAYRRMGGRERTNVLFRLNELTRQLALSGIRRRHPEYSEAEALRALRRLMLGDEITRAVWPDDPFVDP